MTALKNILVGTDFSECGDDALRFAFTLAAGVGAKVHLLHCFTLRDMLTAAAPDHEHLADADAWAERKLEELAAPYRSSGLVGELIVAMGKTGPTLLETSVRLGIDLVMLGSRPRGGLGHHLFVDVAERALHDAPCPVMVLRHPPRKSQPEWQTAWLTALSRIKHRKSSRPSAPQPDALLEPDAHEWPTTRSDDLFERRIFSER